MVKSSKKSSETTVQQTTEQSVKKSQSKKQTQPETTEQVEEKQQLETQASRIMSDKSISQLERLYKIQSELKSRKYDKRRDYSKYVEAFKAHKRELQALQDAQATLQVELQSQYEKGDSKTEEGWELKVTEKRAPPQNPNRPPNPNKTSKPRKSSTSEGVQRPTKTVRVIKAKKARKPKKSSDDDSKPTTTPTPTTTPVQSSKKAKKPATPSSSDDESMD
jgi:hypothetical protein